MFRQWVRPNFSLLSCNLKILFLLLLRLLIRHRWLSLRSSVLLIFHMLRFHLLIFLHQRAATTESEDETIVAVVTFNVILTTHIASTNRLTNFLKRAERESVTAHTLTKEVSKSLWNVRKEYVHYRYKTKHQNCHFYESAFYRKEYMSIR